MPSKPKTVTKKMLIERVSHRLGISRLDVRDVLEGVLLEVEVALKNSERVHLREFGVWALSERKARKTWLSEQQTFIESPARSVPVFRVHTTLRDRVAKAVAHKREREKQDE